MRWWGGAKIWTTGKNWRSNILHHGWWFVHVSVAEGVQGEDCCVRQLSQFQKGILKTGIAQKSSGKHQGLSKRKQYIGMALRHWRSKEDRLWGYTDHILNQPASMKLFQAAIITASLYFRENILTNPPASKCTPLMDDSRLRSVLNRFNIILIDSCFFRYQQGCACRCLTSILKHGTQW